MSNNKSSASTQAQRAENGGKETKELNVLPNSKQKNAEKQVAVEHVATESVADTVKEVGGPKGLEPTRYGDWEAKGRCYDF